MYRRFTFANSAALVMLLSTAIPALAGAAVAAAPATGDRKKAAVHNLPCVGALCGMAYVCQRSILDYGGTLAGRNGTCHRPTRSRGELDIRTFSVPLAGARSSNAGIACCRVIGCFRI